MVARAGGCVSAVAVGLRLLPAKPPQIAFLNPSVSNMYESETWRAMEKIASKRSAKLAQFEALVDVWKQQQQQIQDVIATRRYLISDAQVAPVGDR